MNKGVIMLVEDDPVLRDLTKRQLALLGYDSLSVCSGEEAVEKSTSRELSLIFMDLGLPGIDGSHATLLIREKELKEHRRRIPIIALTAQTDKGHCISAGMDDFIQKPALLNDFRNALGRWLPA